MDLTSGNAGDKQLQFLNLKLLWGLLAVAFVVLLSIPHYLYCRGLQYVPSDREPVANSTIPKIASDTYWRYFHGEGDPYISAKNPYGVLISFLTASFANSSRLQRDAEHIVLSQAARVLIRREKFDGDWHLANLSALIWISRNWSTNEIIATTLSSSYFGNGTHGIQAAARTYFGIALEDIDEAQVMYLLAMTPSPSNYDPWCNQERHRQLFEAFADRLGRDIEYDSISALPPPPDRCG